MTMTTMMIMKTTTTTRGKGREGIVARCGGGVKFAGGRGVPEYSGREIEKKRERVKKRERT